MLNDFPVEPLTTLFDLNLFIYGRLRNKLSQLLFITFDRSFRMVSISFSFNEVWEEREARPVLIC